MTGALVLTSAPEQSDTTFDEEAVCCLLGLLFFLCTTGILTNVRLFALDLFHYSVRYTRRGFGKPLNSLAVTVV